MSAEHLSFAQVVDYLDGRLRPEQVRQVEDHLGTGCPACRADLAWLERTLNTMKNERWSEPPEWARRRARALYAQRHPQSAAQAERPARTLAKRPTWLFPARGGKATRPLRTGWPNPRWAAVALGIILVLASLALWQSTRPSPAYAATLEQVSGDVEIRSADDESWRPGRDGLTVYSGAGIRTGDNGRMVLVFQGKQSATLSPSAKLLVRKIGGRNGQITEVELEQTVGEVEYVIQPANVTGSYYEVTTKAGEIVATQVAHCTVRVDADGTTWLTVAEGAVIVTSGGQQQMVTAGQVLMIVPSSPQTQAATVAPLVTPTATELSASATPSPLPATATPRPTETSRPEPTDTEQPGPTETEHAQPTQTEQPELTETGQPEPTETEQPKATETEQPEPTETGELQPTQTPRPQPTATGRPQPTQTEAPEPTEPSERPGR